MILFYMSFALKKCVQYCIREPTVNLTMISGTTRFSTNSYSSPSI